MIKILLSVAVVGSVGSFAGLATALDGPDSDRLSTLTKLEAQCWHRFRTMPPDPSNDCLNKLRGDAKIGDAQGDAAAVAAGQAAGAAAGGGPGNSGQGNGIGPGGNGNGLAKGRK